MFGWDVNSPLPIKEVEKDRKMIVIEFLCRAFFHFSQAMCHITLLTSPE